MGVPPNGSFLRENLTKEDDLGIPLFQEIPIYQGDMSECMTHDTSVKIYVGLCSIKD